ncbi:YfcE family phosphodiesterase [Candidatus Margulisiibacteriota bacterium]
MKVGIISDLHGNIEAWQAIVKGVFKDVDKILSAGDLYGAGLADPNSPWYKPEEVKKSLENFPIKIIYTKGNCDPDIDHPESTKGELFGKKFYMCHGENCLSDSSKEKLAHKNKAFYFISGHTHKWHLGKNNGIILINPGSPTLSRSPGQLTVAIMDEKEISIVDVISQQPLATIPNQ